MLTGRVGRCAGATTQFATRPTEWYGPLSTDGGPSRPGNTYQDSLSATSALNAAFFVNYHTYVGL